MRYVVLGAAGSIGNAVARAAAAAGHTVRAVARDPARIPDLPAAVERRRADVLDVAQLTAACQGADVVVHAVNVPYQRWPELVPKIASNIRQVVEAFGGILAFPGNVYPYGPPQQSPVTEMHPIAPQTVKGKVRAAVEREFLDAHAAGRLRLVLPIYPDFYGPCVLNRLYAPIFEAALSGKACRWPINADIPHEFIFIDDAAKAMVRMADTPKSQGVRVHVPGPGTVTGREFAGLAYAAGGHAPRVKVFGRGLWRFAGLFNAEVRGAYEMAYLFEGSLILGGSRYEELVGEARPATLYPEGVRRTVEWFRSPSFQSLRPRGG